MVTIKSKEQHFFCQPHVSIFLGNLLGNLKLLFLPKYIANTYFSLKFFIIYDKTIFDAKELQQI